MRLRGIVTKKSIKRSFLFLFFACIAFLIIHRTDQNKIKQQDFQVSPLDETMGDFGLCNFFYILAGKHATYMLHHLHSWMKATGCTIQMIRPFSDLVLSNINTKEKEILNILKKYHPVIMADYLKLLTLFYSPSNYSLVVDFDVKLLKNFPSQWLPLGLKGCSVFWSIENDCYDEACSLQYDGRTAQLTTWMEVSLEKNSIILRDLIDYVSDRLMNLASSTENELATLRVQDFSGSGPITNWIRKELNIDYTSLPLSPATHTTLKESPGSILHIPYKDQVICIGGEATAGNACAYLSPTPSTCLVKHYFEGSWKNRLSFTQKMKKFFWN